MILIQMLFFRDIINDVENINKNIYSRKEMCDTVLYHTNKRMKILVCINGLLNTDNREILLDKTKEDDPSILNTDNENALEVALQLKDKDPDTRIIAIGVGPLKTQEMLRECIARGADDALLLTDESYDYKNQWTVAKVLSEGIKSMDDMDLILAGKQEFDLGIIHTMPQVAESTGFPLVSEVGKFEIADNKVIVNSELENEDLRVETSFPCILSVTKEVNIPRYTTVQGMLDSLSVEIKQMNAKDLGIDVNEDIYAKPTELMLEFPLKQRDAGIVIDGDSPGDIASNLMNHLRKRAVL